MMLYVDGGLYSVPRYSECMSANRLGLCRSVNDSYVATVVVHANTAKMKNCKPTRHKHRTLLCFDGDLLGQLMTTPSPSIGTSSHHQSFE